MPRRPVRLAAVLLSLAAALSARAARAQFQAQRYTLTADERRELTAGCDHLRKSLDRVEEQLRRTFQPPPAPLADVELFLDAVTRNLEQNLFFSARQVAQARTCLADGEKRAAELAAGRAPWQRQTGVVVFGYRSRIDGSYQPYQAYVPENYDSGARKPMRLTVFLHGRGGNLNELTFLSGKGWVRGSFGTDRLDHFALYPYGRGNNGWRYAGEQDVFEALEDFERRFPVDPDQVALRGFSMGGHGAWHIGLQYPGEWAAVSPGAGFVETRQYLKLNQEPPTWQAPLLHLYDPLDYALNAKDVPVLAYVGETDTFHAQHRLMDAALTREGAPFREFIGPNTGHAYERNTLHELIAAIAPLKREPEARTIDFVTYTLRFPRCKWARIEGMEKQWERAEVHARAGLPSTTVVTTRNVSALSLDPPGFAGRWRFDMDGQRVTLIVTEAGAPVTLVKSDGRWSVAPPRSYRENPPLRKTPGLQGPIDDALFGFSPVSYADEQRDRPPWGWPDMQIRAVYGTGKPWSERMDRWTKQEMERFRQGWSMYFRGTLPEMPDRNVYMGYHAGNLYLFGDPGSNEVIARLLPKLPLKWTRDHITIAGKTFSTRDYLPMLVYPNPESPDHYVVINCGFSFSRADMEGSNARQFPHLPDYAVIRYDPDRFSDDRTQDTVLAGFFDERWRIPKR